LTFAAIRAVPVHKHALAAVALLPPILFNRSTLDADQFTVGLAFFFLALVIREIAGTGRIGTRTLAAMAIGAFILAQCKSAYLLLPLLSLAIPVSRFGSVKSKFLACALICLPGIIASFAWMIALKLSYFDNILQYRTWSGVVRPQDQMQLILSQPLGYASIVLTTIFATSFIPKTVLEFLGAVGPAGPLPLAFYPVALTLLAGVIFSGPRITAPALTSSRLRSFAIGIAAATVLIVLTLLYVQWTRYLGPVIEGFQGRYLYPLAPLLLLVIPAAGKPFFNIPARGWLLAIGVLSIGATWSKAWAAFYA
jgi:uncharacterized membrane protein